MYVYIWICSFDIYFRHRILQLRYVGSAFLSKRQRSFFNKKASLKARWLRSPSKQVMGFWNQLDWCFNRDLKNRNVPWQIHRNYNKTQCTLIFSKCKLNNILCPTIISFYPSQLKDGRNLMGIFRGNLQPFSAVQLHEASTCGCDWPCVLDTLDESHQLRVGWVPPWVGWKGGKWSPNDRFRIL